MRRKAGIIKKKGRWDKEREWWAKKMKRLKKKGGEGEWGV